MKLVTDTWEEVQAQSRAQLPESIVNYIDDCLVQPHPHSRLITVLHKVQSHYGYLGKEQMDAVAQLLQIPTAKVTGVATFYHFFRLQQPGKMVINVCMGTACYVKGAERLADKIRDELGIGFGETTKDGLFTMESVHCLGTCGLAPVITIGEQVHGQVTPSQIPNLLEKAIKLIQG